MRQRHTGRFVGEKMLPRNDTVPEAFGVPYMPCQPRKGSVIETARLKDVGFGRVAQRESTTLTS